MYKVDCMGASDSRNQLPRLAGDFGCVVAADGQCHGLPPACIIVGVLEVFWKDDPVGAFELRVALATLG